MLCDDCKKNSACVHLTQIMNGEKVDKQLCEHCAQKYGELVFTNSNNFSVNDFLHSLFSNNSPASQQQQFCVGLVHRCSHPVPVQFYPRRIFQPNQPLLRDLSRQ